MKYFFLVGIIALSLTACKEHEHAKHEDGTFLVTGPVLKDTLVYSEYVCQVRSIQHIELRTLEKGYLQNIYVDEGQYVRKGQLLFQIMPAIYQAEMLKAQAEVNFVEIEYKNTKNLADSNIVSQNELALAKAKLDKAKAELTLAQTHLGFTEIRAPFDGIIGRFNDVRLGSLVDEGELLTTLSDNSRVWVYFNVPETEYLNYTKAVKSGNRVQVKLRLANNQLFDQSGVVETIEADFNNETGNIAFRATFPNPKSILRHGQTGNILMPVELHNALLIPQKATFEILDKKYVYTLQDSTVQLKEIKVESEMPHIYAVAEGIAKEDKILVEGLRKVKNGQHIKYQFVEQQQVLAELGHLHAE